MPNFVSLCIELCEPAPVNGYRVTYRPLGTSEEFRTFPVNFDGPDVQFVVSADPDGTQYEGFVYGDCGNGQAGVGIPWATAEESSSASTSASGGGGSASASSTPGEGTITVDGCIAEGSITEVRWAGLDVLNVSGDFPVNPGQSITVGVIASGSHTLAVTGENGGRVRVVDSLGNAQCQDAPGFGTLNFPAFVIILGQAWSVTMDCGTCE